MREPIVRSEAQLRERRRNIVVLSALGGLIVLVFLISMNTGYTRLSPFDVIRTLFGGGDADENLILFEFRLPRIVISVLVGMGLAVSGCVLQALSRNALADPGIVGVNAGAGLMVLLFVAFYASPAAAPVYVLPVIAWFGAFVTATFVFLLSYRRHKGLSPTRLLLNGVAVTSGISAVTIVLTLRISPEQYQFVATWMAGSIWGKDWSFVLALLPFLLVLLPYVWLKAQTINVLNLGESMARSLGARVTKEQVGLLAAAVGLAGTCVAVSGSIGFVGLLAPHLARRLIGPKHQVLIPASAFIGGLLVITADTIGRSILQPSGVPAGIVVAVIGAPYFLYLMVKAKK
ncbi:FecCD family ABC transporter permease [Cohnella sp. GCM10027633]|uniref:FecCD family ABC transporter permease n=1 Tax=unclassified Cohnella TaxID=2636738 RepID=UPI00363BFC80